MYLRDDTSKRFGRQKPGSVVAHVQWAGMGRPPFAKLTALVQPPPSQSQFIFFTLSSRPRTGHFTLDFLPLGRITRSRTRFTLKLLSLLTFYFFRTWIVLGFVFFSITRRWLFFDFSFFSIVLSVFNPLEICSRFVSQITRYYDTFGLDFLCFSPSIIISSMSEWLRSQYLNRYRQNSPAFLRNTLPRLYSVLLLDHWLRVNLPRSNVSNFNRIFFLTEIPALRQYPRKSPKLKNVLSKFTDLIKHVHPKIFALKKTQSILSSGRYFELGKSRILLLIFFIVKSRTLIRLRKCLFFPVSSCIFSYVGISHFPNWRFWYAVRYPFSYIRQRL